MRFVQGFPKKEGHSRDWNEAAAGSRAPPTVTESPYLYPYMPQQRRAGSSAPVVKTRMRTRTHMGSTEGARKGKKSISVWGGQSWRIRRGEEVRGGEARQSPQTLLCAAAVLPKLISFGCRVGGRPRHRLRRTRNQSAPLPAPRNSRFKRWEVMWKC